MLRKIILATQCADRSKYGLVTDSINSVGRWICQQEILCRQSYTFYGKKKKNYFEVCNLYFVLFSILNVIFGL
jgi:hypothetical protein